MNMMINLNLFISICANAYRNGLAFQNESEYWLEWCADVHSQHFSLFSPNKIFSEIVNMYLSAQLNSFMDVNELHRTRVKLIASRKRYAVTLDKGKMSKKTVVHSRKFCIYLYLLHMERKCRLAFCGDDPPLLPVFCRTRREKKKESCRSKRHIRRQTLARPFAYTWLCCCCVVYRESGFAFSCNGYIQWAANALEDGYNSRR